VAETLPPAPTPEMLSAFRRPVWVYNLDAHRIEAASPAALVLWRADTVDALAQRPLGALTPAASARLADNWAALLRGEVVGEQWTLYPGGHPTAVHCSFAAVHTASGARAMLIEAEPRTPEAPDTQRAVEALRHDPAPMMLFSFPEGSLLLANPAARAALAEVGSLDALFVEAEAPARVRGQIAQAGTAWGEDHVLTQAGLRVAAWRAARGVDPVSGGEMVAITLLDVTDARAATQAHLEALSQAIEATQDGIALTDAAGNFTFMNPAHLRMFGYDDNTQVAGRPWSILYSDAERERFLAEIFPVLTGPGARWRGNAVGLRLDGSVVMQDVSLTIHQDGGIICLTRDNGERLAAEAQRRRLEVELAQAQKMEAVGQFVGGLAHDLNNLLAAILATSTGIAAQHTNADRVRMGCERIDRAGAQAARMVRRMLDFVRREEGPPVRVDLRAVLVRSTELLRALLPKRVTLEVLPGDQVFRALVQEDRIVQVLLNLAANARDAMGTEAGHVTVRLGVAAPAPAGDTRFGRGSLPAGEAAEIVVEDTGPGVPPDVFPRLFEAFYTTKPAGQGTGLGLSTSAGILTDAGGRLEGWNTGKGAAFRLILPIQAVDQVSRVILAHSDPELADLIARVLDREGYVVEAVGSARAALDTVLGNPGACRLLLADADAPGLRGDALLTALRQAHIELPVLLTSRGLTPSGTLPTEKYLRTPFSTAALLAAVAEALGDA
jgi:PAS domain S-box-containing protein